MHKKVYVKAKKANKKQSFYAKNCHHYAFCSVSVDSEDKEIPSDCQAWIMRLDSYPESISLILSPKLSANVNNDSAGSEVFRVNRQNFL